MLKKIVSGVLLVMMVLSLAGCVKRTDTSQQPQQKPVQGDNILDSFIIEKRDDEEAEEKEERISLSLDDLKKKPEQEEKPAEEEEPEKEEPEEQEADEESGSKDGNSYEYYRGQVAGDSDLGEPIEFDMDSTPVFEDSSAVK